MTKVLFEGGSWFAWFPVRLYNHDLAWLVTVHRERFVSSGSTGPWRYYLL